MTTSSSATLDVTSVRDSTSPGEGCPTPLAWQEVLAAVRAGGRRHQAESRHVTVKATSFGTGAPLYLLPGFFGDHELYVLTSWLLREECCCVMVDPPTIRSRISMSSSTRLKESSAAIFALADELGHGCVRLHGPNFGGMMALQAMIDQPQRVAVASLQCAFPRLRSTFAERMIASVGSRSRRVLGDVRSAMRIQESNHRRWFPPFDHTRWDFYANNIGATVVADVAMRARVAAAVDLSDELKRTHTPVLIIESEGDGPIARSAQQQLSAGLENARVEAIDNCGRLPHVTHPHRLVKLLRSFWEEAGVVKTCVPG